MEFVAIDFETANRNSDSACSIGLVTFKDGIIVVERSTDDVFMQEMKETLTEDELDIADEEDENER